MFAVAVPSSSRHMLRHHVSFVALEVHCRSLAGIARSPRCRTCTRIPLGNRSPGQEHSRLPWRNDLHMSRTSGPAVHAPHCKVHYLDHTRSSFTYVHCVGTSNHDQQAYIVHSSIYLCVKPAARLDSKFLCGCMTVTFWPTHCARVAVAPATGTTEVKVLSWLSCSKHNYVDCRRQSARR
jgi:hypothetical protein